MGKRPEHSHFWSNADHKSRGVCQVAWREDSKLPAVGWKISNPDKGFHSRELAAKKNRLTPNPMKWLHGKKSYHCFSRTTPLKTFSMPTIQVYFPACCQTKPWNSKMLTVMAAIKNKDRLTAMTCSNMDSSDKLPLLVIGKAANPRCFKNVKSLPVQYHANKKAWMTSEIFIAWVKELDKKMMKKNRKIVLVVNNCSAQPQIPGLQSVELVFLLLNTMSNTQLMDQGIIQNLKVHYRKRVLLRYIADTDQSKVPHISILDAIHMLSQAWNCMTPQTITNCFRHAGFSTDKAAATSNDDEDFDVEDDIPLSRLREHGLTPEVLTELSLSLDFENTALPLKSWLNSPD